MSVTYPSKTEIFIMMDTMSRLNSNIKEETHPHTHTEAKTKVNWIFALASCG